MSEQTEPQNEINPPCALRPGDPVKLSGTGEVGRVLCTWPILWTPKDGREPFEEGYDCYVAFFGWRAPTKEWCRKTGPYTLRYYDTSLIKLTEEEFQNSVPPTGHFSNCSYNMSKTVCDCGYSQARWQEHSDKDGLFAHIVWTDPNDGSKDTALEAITLEQRDAMLLDASVVWPMLLTNNPDLVTIQSLAKRVNVDHLLENAQGYGFAPARGNTSMVWQAPKKTERKKKA